MEFSRQQEHALGAVASWIHGGTEGKPFFYLAGFAGTGKTTLATHLAEGVAGQVLFAAFTGKAALVMRRKGCPGATTLHSLIYLPQEKSRERMEELEEQLEVTLKAPPSTEMQEQADEIRREIAAERARLRRPSFGRNPDSALKDASLLVVDECSMVDERLALDVLSFGVPVLVLGDPGQLPPVRGAGYFTSHEPDFMLTDVHRQALDSPVLRMATAVREGKSLPYGHYGDSEVISTADFVADRRAQLSEETQVLCGLNRTRHRANGARRAQILGGETPPTPIPGDRLVCLRNNHEQGLLNGAIWLVDDAQNDPTGETVFLSLREDDGPGRVEVLAHAAPFRGEEVPWATRMDAEEFDFGYCLTVHKSQGSQWPRICLVDESQTFRGDATRWLYTGITRAAEAVTVVR